jgi:uncharacterized membrane protein
MFTGSSSTLFRLSGLALLTALPIQIAGWLIHPASERIADVLSPWQTPAHLIMFASWFLVLLGLPGLYVWQARRAGLLGLVGFIATVFTTVNVMFIVLYEASPTVLLAQNPATQAVVVPGEPLAHGGALLGGVVAMIGLLAYPLFGLATLRAGVFPKLVGWLQIASVLIGVIPTLLLPDDVLFSIPGALQPIAFLYYLLVIAYARGGFVLWQARDVAAPRAAVEAARYSAAPAQVG